jgi:uncharacterized membrane protein
MSSVDIRSANANKTLPTIAWATCLFGMWPIGLIIAYVDLSNTNAVYASHYRYLIRTMWIGLLFLVISFLLSFVAIGLLTMIATSIWYLIRCVKGLVLVLREEPISDPGTWLV